MPVPSLLQPFVTPLERSGLVYCITGSVAASIYGEPRLTADIDVVMLLPAQSIPLLRAVFPEQEYYREGRSDKHLRDIRFVLAATTVDRDMIDREVATRGLSNEWLACSTG